MKKKKAAAKEFPAPEPMIESELPVTGVLTIEPTKSPVQGQPMVRVICPRCDTINSFRPMRGGNKFDQDYKQCRRCGFKVRI